MEDLESPNSELFLDNLTWREQDILNLLAERLSNREIAERLYLAESTVKDYVGRILAKLQVKNRRQAAERAKELGILENVPESASSRKLNLPSSPTPFIGRTSELELIKKELEKTRLLTLSGPGGMGKTRLALRTAELFTDDFRNGSFFVSLAPIRSVEHIIQAVAEAVNFPLPTNEDPKSQLIRYLQKKNLFLVIDNFEHLLGGVGIVSEILQNTSDVKILVTSREKLNLQGETNLSVTGMKVDGEIDSEGASKIDALALFLDTASKARPGFDPSPDELTQIGQICHFVGGMPLAIELAASWLHVLSVNEINDELNKGLDILETEMRDAPERHRSVRAVFDASWSLLEVEEQEIFMRLSIFKGGFARQAAQQVAGASLRQIGELVNKSILKHDPDTGRLEIHELLRQYAQEYLENSQQTSRSTKEAYAAYFADFMWERWKLFKTSGQMLALAEIEADIENIRAAWRYCLDQKNSSQLLKFVYSFWIIYWIRGWTHGAIELFSDGVNSLARSSRDTDIQVVQAVLMAFQAFFMSWVGLAEDGYKLTRQSIEILERFEHPVELAFAYHSMTLVAYYLNQPAAEMDAAQKFLEIAKRSNDKWLLAYGLWLVSLAEFRCGNLTESKRLAESSLKVCEQNDDSIGSAWCLLSLGEIAMFHGELPRAEYYISRCLRISEELDFLWLFSNASKYLGQVALLSNDVAVAQAYLIQSLKIAYDLGLDRDITNHLFDFANLRVAQERREDGIELLSLLLQQPASYHARLGGGRIRDHALKLLADLENELSPQAYLGAIDRGELLDMATVVVELVALNS
jgi:predicted ATPase/DNA-binding CsgD family transcriptional regulator